MKYKIEVLYAAVLLIVNLPGCTEDAKARAIRDLIPSITGHAHARMRGDPILNLPVTNES